MSNHSIEKYKKERYDDQLKWYTNQASNNKKKYYILQVIIIVLSSVVTLSVATGMHFEEMVIWNFTSLFVSALVVLFTSLQKIFRFHENWVEYRSTEEQMKKERSFFEFKCGDYSDSQFPDQLFIERIESLLSKQNTSWTKYTVKRPKQ